VYEIPLSSESANTNKRKSQMFGIFLRKYGKTRMTLKKLCVSIVVITKKLEKTLKSKIIIRLPFKFACISLAN